jgi:transcriptional regulator with XRE-family HTH domain
MTLGEQIRHHRQRLALAQVDLAVRLGVRGSSVSLWELDKELPSTASLQALARVFGVVVTLDGQTVRLGAPGGDQRPGPLGQPEVTFGQPVAKGDQPAQPRARARVRRAGIRER